MKIAILNGSPRKENTAVCKVVGEDNKKTEKMAEIKAWAATIK